jgi:hypothetical protein
MCYFPRFAVTEKNTLANVIQTVVDKGIDLDEFEDQRNRWLAREARIRTRIERILPTLLSRLVHGRPMRIYQVRAWPNLSGAIISALILEQKLLVKSRFRQLADSFYKRLRNLR